MDTAATGGLTARRVLVTGASGFIGSRLSERLATAGAEVHGVARRSRPGGEGIEWWSADLADAEAVDGILRAVEPDAVFHLGSQVSGRTDLDLVEPMLQSNLRGALNVLTAAQRHSARRVVLAGTMLETSSDGIPISPYAAAKAAAAAYARMFGALYGTPVVNLRLFMVYGPGQLDLSKLVPHVTTSLLTGRTPTVSSGRRPVDWVYVDDVVDAFIAAAEVPGIEGETLDVGSGELVTIRALVERLRDLVGPQAKVDFGGLADRPLERPQFADVARSRRLMNWQPQASLDDGLRQTIAWYRAGLESGALRA